MRYVTLLQKLCKKLNTAATEVSYLTRNNHEHSNKQCLKKVAPGNFFMIALVMSNICKICNFWSHEASGNSYIFDHHSSFGYILYTIMCTNHTHN